ncbi:disaggregatase related repeat-containing protein, partial [Methanococcoides sp. NM1]|uniref:disaggregatase related repeat-containing protein n=1 Tax=Methanococcoides sp. NM1 TaxID=1201013 RepID=UPI001082F3CF
GQEVCDADGTLRWQYTGNWNVAHVFTFESTGQVSQPEQPDVNSDPVMNFIGSKSVDEGSTLSFSVSASDADGDVLSYSVTGLPSGSSFDSSTGAFSWTPSEGQDGSYEVTFEVSDGQLTDSETIPITVYSVNHAPVMNSIGSKSVDEGSTLSFSVSAFDADGDVLSYSVTGLPSGSSFDSSTGAFSWTPSEGQSGTHSVTFEVTDGQVTDSEEVTITVNGNSDPTQSLVYDNRLREASPDSVYSDNDYIDIGHNTDVGRYRDVMWFDLSMYNTTDTIANATLSLYWYYPANNPRSQDTVVEIYRAADWNSGYVSWNNKAAGIPWNNPGGDWFDKNNVAQGSEPYASITFDANNLPDDKYYEFNITELVQDYVSDEYDNTGFFLKAQNEYDNYIAFYSCDWSNENQRPKLTITHTSGTEPVNNNAPVLNSIGSRTLEVGNSLSFMVSASDADDDTLTYSATGLPAGATIDTTSGEFSWTPSDGQAGTYGVMFEVSDGELIDSEAIIITVNAISNDPLINSAPVITAFGPANDAVFEEGNIINIGVTVSDADGQELNYLLKIDGVTVSTTSSYVWNTDHSNAGTHTIEAVVSDGTDQVAAQHVLTIINIHPRWDINRDGVVNILDVTIVAQNLGTKKPHPSWDVNGDGEVNIQDLTIVAYYFGETVQ